MVKIKYKIEAVIKSIFVISMIVAPKLSSTPMMRKSFPNLLFTSYQIFSLFRVLVTLNPYKIFGGIFFKINGIANTISRQPKPKNDKDKIISSVTNNHFLSIGLNNKINLICL